MKQSLLFFSLIFLFPLVSKSEIKYVEYHKNKIPNIVTAAGIATEIVFEEDEKIEYHTFGFDKGWSSQVVKDHILIFKPSDPEPETNLIVHTNKRDYIFTITSGNNEWEKHPNRSNAIYALRIIYKDDKSIANKKINNEKEVLRNEEIATANTYIFSNYDYRATPNAHDLIPVRMWDNGKITFIAFREGVKRGVIYELDEQNKAHLLNQNTEKNGLLIVHGVYKHLILRLGDQAVEIVRNEQYGKIENNMKTNVNSTVRTISSEAPIDFKKIEKKENESQKEKIENMQQMFNLTPEEAKLLE